MKNENLKSKWQQALDYGIDMNQLAANLKLTPTERIIRLQQTLDFMNVIRQAGKLYSAELKRAHKCSDDTV